MTMPISRRLARKGGPHLNNTGLTKDAPPRFLRNGSTGVEIAVEKNRRSWYWPQKIISSPSSPASFCRKPLRLLLNRVRSYVRRSNPTRLAISGTIFLFALFWLLKWWLFGPRGSIAGGEIGQIIHQYGRDYARYKTMTKWREEVRSLRLVPGQLIEPSFFPLDCVIRTRPNAAVVEMLLREQRRVAQLASMVEATDTSRDACSKDEMSPVQIPRTVLQLLAYHEQTPLLPYWLVRSSLDVDSIAIRDSDIKPPLSTAIRNCRTISHDAHLTCMAHHLGGMQLSNSLELHHSRLLVSNILSLIGSPNPNNLLDVNLGGGTCNSKLGYAVLSGVPTPDEELRKTSSISSRISTVFAAFPPNHPGSLCVPPLDQTVGISPYNEANEELSFRSTFSNRLLAEIEAKDPDGIASLWGIATLPCNVEPAGEHATSNCCNQAKVTILDSLDAGEIKKHLKEEHGRSRNNNQNHHLIFTLARPPPTANEEEISDDRTETASVKITERPRRKRPVTRRKESIQTGWRCEPSYWCNRCLRLSVYGSFSACPSCSKCAVDAICDTDGDALSKREPVEVDVLVTRSSPTASGELAANRPARRNRIPRIIHQTYFEEITIEKYPQLLRLQNTWRNSGWEYRFYDDDAARGYVETNYPERFVRAFDSLLLGAYKADFFRYLVLYKEGGLYVDVDVMLNANLDNFITPDLAFFAPLDAVGNYADEPFCVWNGMLGSAPAHPALANVIEWMINLVTHRGDMYDMERAVCRLAGADKIENWKVRVEPVLLLSGPCALGLAVNKALGNEPLSKFRVGLLKREGFNTKNIEDLDSDAVGNVLFLLADKDDLGEFRFSDPERNIMVASTELAGLLKSPMKYEKDQRIGLRQKPHYSISTRRPQQLWGTYDVYADDMDVDEEVTLNVSHK